jgi:hypothetical protein
MVSGGKLGLGGLAAGALLYRAVLPTVSRASVC